MAKRAQTVCAGIVTRLGDAGKSKLGAVALSSQPCGEASRAVAAWLARTQDAAEVGIVSSDFAAFTVPAFGTAKQGLLVEDQPSIAIA